MNKFSPLFFVMLCCAFQLNAQLSVRGLTCENLINPLAVDRTKPKFGWQLDGPGRNVMQAAYAIRVYSRPGNKTLVWESGKVNSDQSEFVQYGGPALESGRKYYWQVKVWDNQGHQSAWSGAGNDFFQMGMLSVADWKAKWIEPGYTEDSVARPSPLLRKEFAISKKIQSATAYITAHGLYEAGINSQRMGNAYLTPGWTSYNKRLQYQAYDVTGLLQKGANVLTVSLGSGWYRGFLAWGGNKNVYGKKLGLLLQINIEYTDGTKQTIVSDGSWKSAVGAIKSAEIYDGEIYDARDAKEGWEKPGYDDSKWTPVNEAEYANQNLIATRNELIVKHEVFKPVRILTTPKGEKVIDFGQNLVGWVVLKAKGHAGDSIIVSHAEILDKAGNFYTDNLRAAKARDIYILKGGEQEVFEPHFTFHGFQYIRIEGYPGDLKPEDFTAVALYSDMKKTGSFTSSNQLINQLQHNIQWGQRGNFLDVPTDCPQRDERLGWTGDAQVFSRTATFNMGVDNFFSKWLQDVAADQQPNGSVPFVVPNVLGPGAGGSTGWADVSTIIPWNLYLAYGDKQVLEQQYGSMKAWVDYMKSKSINDLWNTGFHFGDWLFYRPDDDNDGRSAVTDKYLIAQCFYANSTQLLIKAAAVLGKTDDVSAYSALLQKIKEAFTKEYMTPNGRLVSGTQTAYVLALNFDMLPESLRSQAAMRLADNVKDYGYHLTTGFLGTPYLCHVLSRFGYTDIAYKLLLQETYPSWLYPVKMGATTIWERWDGEKPDSSFQTPGMNSFNHYSYGAIGDWMYRVVAGLDTYEDGPGYKHISIIPHAGGGLTMAAADLETHYGKISSHWKMENGRLILDVEIPVNTQATILIPATATQKVTESGISLADVKDLRVSPADKGTVHVDAGSGKYHFEISQ